MFYAVRAARVGAAQSSFMPFGSHRPERRNYPLCRSGRRRRSDAVTLYAGQAARARAAQAIVLYSVGPRGPERRNHPLCRSGRTGWSSAIILFLPSPRSFFAASLARDPSYPHRLAMPKQGDRILVLKSEWLSLLLERVKVRFARAFVACALKRRAANTLD